MQIVHHRRNTAAMIDETPPEFGAEIDVRSLDGRLILQHDPFLHGEDCELWLTHYRHRLLILNVKEDGLEDRLLELMDRAGVVDFFFLDQPFPTLVKTIRRGERRCAVRVSEFESVETALSLAGLLDWVWVDSFDRFPLSADQGRRLVDAGFKLCVVSPELQGRPTGEIARLRDQLASLALDVDAVCTKAPTLWL